MAFALGSRFSIAGWTRGVEGWLSSYVKQAPRHRRARREQQSSRDGARPYDVFLCIADHYEPRRGNPDLAKARWRLNRWLEDYPRLFGEFRDSDGRPPRHTFFYPIDQYDPFEVDALNVLCGSGFGETEIHLHHDHDTSENLRETLNRFKTEFAARHGQLARDRQGEIRYAFAHGNWALDNSLPDGRWCGVNDEIEILRQTGCYADFTLPSAPSAAQTRKINSIYYAVDDPNRPKSHDDGVDVGAGPIPERGLMMIQGPLLLNWRSRKWGVMPRIENACLQGTQPPSIDRLRDWMSAAIGVASRPDWIFVKLHTHGAHEPNLPIVLGEPMVRFHRDLAALARSNPRFRYHYVTARETYNLIKAAEAGWTGSPRDAMNFELVWNGMETGKASR